jgi:hypothetical protein
VYLGWMTDIHVSCGREPQDLAKVIAATLHGLVPAELDDEAAVMGRLIRAAQERAELARGSRHDLPTVNFETIDPETDWSDV